MIKTELISHMGSDLTVVNSARVSFNKESCLSADGSLSEQDAKLIDYLAKHQHITPFTHPQITLRETIPIFVARQRFKHVVGFTYNEVSRRYVDDTPEFFVPETWRARPDKSIKQGSGDAHSDNTLFKAIYSEYLRNARSTYENMIACGVAPEQARMVLPQSMLTSYYVTGSLAAYARAYKQRVDPHAQAEIQSLAHQWGNILSGLFPVSWVALTKA
jgi:thymidylate synthase (FAD)